jgi:hypothetical protein
MRGDNSILVASRRPLPIDAMSTDQVDQFVGDARVLTDDHAPVDRLHTTAD